ncbi:GFA family protein [Roseomonas sp. GCM10028921]
MEKPGEEPLKGSCHYGAVRFEVVLADGLRSARRCTCSICRMRGAVTVSAALDGVRILAGADKLATYQFNTRMAKHHFCSVRGIYTHHQRRSDPRQFGVNLACLKGISPFDRREFPVNDGVNHPSDSGVSRLAGVLRFFPAEDGA